MKIANIAEFKDHLGRYIALVEQGEEIELCKRNVPVARIIPLQRESMANKTRLGSGLNSVTIKTDLTEPAFSFDDWHMLKGEQ
jgi:prevent-host-death family protein